MSHSSSRKRKSNEQKDDKNTTLLPPPLSSTNVKKSKRNQSQPPLIDGSKLKPPSKNKSTSPNLKGKKNKKNPKLPYDYGFYLNKSTHFPKEDASYRLTLKDLMSGDFNSCLLCNFMYEMPWLFKQCPRLKTLPVLLIHGERDPKRILRDCKPYPNIKVHIPHLPIPYGTHHSKMLILIYATGIRIAIFTANFIAIDWENKTQGIWIQDFPFKKTNPPRTCAFERDLITYLQKLGNFPLLNQFVTSISKFNYSKAWVHLVASTPGYHQGENVHQFGHPRLRWLLKKYGKASKFSPIVCQASSVGSLDKRWFFHEFGSTLTSDSLLKEPLKLEKYEKLIHFIWPTVENVRNSCEGWTAGCSLPLSSSNMKEFLYPHLRKWRPSKSLQLDSRMPHIKTYTRFHESKDHSVDIDWCLLTSANLSKAAWGTFQKRNTQVMIRSYEIGVLFFPSCYQHVEIKFSNTPNHPILGNSSPWNSETEVKSEDSLHKPLITPITSTTSDSSVPIRFVGMEDSFDSTNLKRFEGHYLLHFPLPFINPLYQYMENDDPWCWDIPQNEMDAYGCTYNPMRQ